MSEFHQPKLADAEGAALPEAITQMVADNADKTDELSLAAAAAFNPVHAPLPPEPQLPPGRFCLDYIYNGQKIHETHRTTRTAIARIAALKRIGIVPATSTVDVPATV